MTALQHYQSAREKRHRMHAELSATQKMEESVLPARFFACLENYRKDH